MSDQIRVLSVYEGFFSGGARILHSNVLAGLHGWRGQKHSVLSIHGQMYRESTLQLMEQDVCYRKLVAGGLPVSTLGHGVGGARPFDEEDLAAAARLLAGADIVLTLKEQPLRLVNQIDLGNRPVITCLHRSDPENQGPSFRALLESAESGRLTAAVCCAHSTKQAYAEAGIPAELLHVIPNGVDLRRFRPSRPARAAVRAAQGIAADAPVIAFAARYDPMKNVALFLAAASVFLDRHPAAHVLMFGPGMSSANPGLAADLAAAGLDRATRPGAAARIHLLGPRPDPESYLAAADVVALTSAYGEAAPLCLIEGMLCGAVPVATDVGDCAVILDGRGLITAPEAEPIAAAWAQAIAQRPQFQQAATRSRHQFGHSRMISAYGALIQQTYRAAPRTVWFPAIPLPIQRPMPMPMPSAGACIPAQLRPVAGAGAVARPVPEEMATL